MKNKKLLIVIDANSVIHRAFHALPPLIDKKGNQTGAIYGFILVLFRAIKISGLTLWLFVLTFTLQHFATRNSRNTKPKGLLLLMNYIVRFLGLKKF